MNTLFIRRFAILHKNCFFSSKFRHRWWGKKRIRGLFTKLSEGNLYNIVNHEIKHEDRYSERVSRDTRRIQSKERASRFEMMQKKKSQVKSDMESQRSFNRISPKRETQRRHRGFDPITNQSFKGFNSKHLHPLRKTDSPPLWMKLKGGKWWIFL